jgi:hypothetical protein
MAGKKSKNTKPQGNDFQQRRRTRILQIAFTAFCVIMVLSMLLAAVSK